MKCFHLGALIVLVGGLTATPTFANLGNAGLVTIGGQPFEVPLQFQNGVLFFNAAGQTSDPNGGAFTVSGTMDPGNIGLDPFISFGISVTDFGTPTLFTIAFSVPISPVGSPNTVAASLSGTLTDAAGDGVGLTPAAALLTVNTVDAPTTNMGVDLGGPASFGQAPPGTTHPYGPFNAGPQLGPGPGPWTVLTSTSSFTASGGSDVIGLEGLVSIVPGAPDSGAVPEPLTAGLTILSGLGLLAAATRRRGRTC